MLVAMIPGLGWRLPGWLQAVLATPVVFGAGLGFFRRAGRQALHFQSSMDTLIALGSGIAWAFAVSEWWRGAHHLSFETASALVAFLLTGKYLEARAKSRRYRCPERPFSRWRHPQPFGLKPMDQCLRFRSSALRPGDRTRVLPGQAVPADGCVITGQAEVDESMLTGEPMPMPKGPGDALVAGTVVHGSALEQEIQAVGADTQLARMAAWWPRPRVPRLRPRIWLTVSALCSCRSSSRLQLVTFAGWWWLGGGFDHAWRPAVTLLVIAMPLRTRPGHTCGGDGGHWSGSPEGCPRARCGCS